LKAAKPKKNKKNGRMGGKWKVESGKRHSQMISGRWQVERGKWTVEKRKVGNVK
jgi:hypothetical protein